jgi:hypothetical protein
VNGVQVGGAGWEALAERGVQPVQVGGGLVVVLVPVAAWIALVARIAAEGLCERAWVVLRLGGRIVWNRVRIVSKYLAVGM